MRDFRAFVRSYVEPLALPRHRELEIVEELVAHFLTYFVAIDTGPALAGSLRAHLAGATGGPGKVTALRQVILAILQSQYYQVC